MHGSYHYCENGREKWLLCQMQCKYIPKDLIEKPNNSSDIPISVWLRGSLHGCAETLLDEQCLMQEGNFNPEPVIHKWKELLSGIGYWQYGLWSVLMFLPWLEAQS